MPGGQGGSTSLGHDSVHVVIPLSTHRLQAVVGPVCRQRGAAGREGLSGTAPALRPDPRIASRHRGARVLRAGGGRPAERQRLVRTPGHGAAQGAGLRVLSREIEGSRLAQYALISRNLALSTSVWMCVAVRKGGLLDATGLRTICLQTNTPWFGSAVKMWRGMKITMSVLRPLQQSHQHCVCVQGATQCSSLTSKMCVLGSKGSSCTNKVGVFLRGNLRLIQAYRLQSSEIKVQ